MTEFRQEHKYIISEGSLALLRYRLRAALRPDSHTRPDGSYLIRSLYFDDTDHTAYREKLDGVKERSKLRLRYYNFNEDYILLEKKERDGDRCRKTALQVDRETARRMLEGGAMELEAPLALEFDAKRAEGLHPVVIVDYLRYPFTYPVSNVRVTLDTAIRTPVFDRDFFNPGLATFPVLEEGESVLEVKFDDFLPSYVQQLFADIPKVKTAVSKYTMCLSMLDQ